MVPHVKVFLIAILDQNIQRKQTRIIKQAVSLSTDLFSQTRCLGMLIQVNNFLTQCVATFGELTPLEKTFSDEMSDTFNYYVKSIQSVFKMKKSD